VQEKFCEKIDAAFQAGSYDQAKRYVRENDVFAFLSDGNDAVKMAQNILEKICEKNARLLYRVSEPHKPISDNAEKSFKRENYHLF
jgi:hypothetical protein